MIKRNIINPHLIQKELGEGRNRKKWTEEKNFLDLYTNINILLTILITY